MEKNLSVNFGKVGLFVGSAPGKKRAALNLFVACRLNLPVFWSLLGCINHQKKTSSGRFLSILLPQRKRDKPTNRQTNKGFDWFSRFFSLHRYQRPSLKKTRSSVGNDFNVIYFILVVPMVFFFTPIPCTYISLLLDGVARNDLLSTSIRKIPRVIMSGAIFFLTPYTLTVKETHLVWAGIEPRLLHKWLLYNH